MTSSPQNPGTSPATAPTLSAPGEVAWLERLKDGDARTLESLVDELYPTMTRLAQALLGEASQARDLVQETWVAVMDGLARFEGRASLKTWILRILVNRARTEVSRRGRLELVDWLDQEPPADAPAVEPERFATLGWWATPPRTWGDEGPEGALMRKQLQELILRELEGLPAGQRTVVALRDVEGLSSAEVRAVLGVSEGNQRVLLHRGRSRLRAAVERELERGSR